MAVIGYGDVVVRVFDALASSKEGGATPLKVLMSSRQFNEFLRGRTNAYELFPHRSDRPNEARIFDLPIVICSDCDFYLVFGN